MTNRADQLEPLVALLGAPARRSRPAFGSSRESAPGGLKAAGVSCLVAVSFGRIFFRNAINFGLPALECSESGRIRQGDELEIDVQAGRIRDLTQGIELPAKPLPEHIMALVRVGGLVPHLERVVAERRAAAEPQDVVSTRPGIRPR